MRREPSKEDRWNFDLHSQPIPAKAFINFSPFEKGFITSAYSTCTRILHGSTLEQFFFFFLKMFERQFGQTTLSVFLECTFYNPEVAICGPIMCTLLHSPLEKVGSDVV